MGAKKNNGERTNNGKEIRKRKESVQSVKGKPAKEKGKQAGKPAAINQSLASELKAKSAEKRAKEKHIVSRMWLSTFISKFFMDRGTIPDNIGNNILVTNNLYITKNHLSAMIFVSEMSEGTPVSWTSDLVKYVKEQSEGVIVDITLKGSHYYPDITPSGINTREKQWKATLDNPSMPEEYVRRAARCLYSLKVMRSGAKTYAFRCYITVRAADGSRLRKGIQAVTSYLSDIGATYKRLQSNIDEHLEYCTMMSDKRPPHLKDLAPMIFSMQTIAESMPAIQGANDEKGVLMGYDYISGYPYLIDFKSTAKAKNIMIEALSGWGKTFIAEYWLYPFHAENFNMALMDIKGNEFSAITKSLNGVTLSMRNSSTHYINHFRWSVDEVFDGDYLTYANERFRLAKAKMLVMCDLPDNDESLAEALLEEFMRFIYASIGVTRDNPNTWVRTEKLNPYTVFDMFEKYLSNEIRVKYSKVVNTMVERMRIYMSRKGSKCHVFRDAYNYRDVLDTRCLTFDFGILENSTNYDRILFRMRVMDMTTINDEYVSHKKRKGEWTVKLLEESQIVDDWLTKVYTREMTLRRSQNQVTVLLGNSVAALAENPLSKPMVENINILCLGSLNKSSRRFLEEEFGLKDYEEQALEQIQTNPAMERRFLLINRMQPESTTAILEACVPDDVSSSSLFKVVDTED